MKEKGQYQFFDQFKSQVTSEDSSRSSSPEGFWSDHRTSGFRKNRDRVSHHC